MSREALRKTLSVNIPVNISVGDVSFNVAGQCPIMIHTYRMTPTRRGRTQSMVLELSAVEALSFLDIYLQILERF